VQAHLVKLFPKILTNLPEFYKSQQHLSCSSPARSRKKHEKSRRSSGGLAVLELGSHRKVRKTFFVRRFHSHTKGQHLPVDLKLITIDWVSQIISS